MENFLPPSFIKLIAGVFSACSIIAILCSIKSAIRTHAIRVFAISSIVALALFSENGWVYFASVFIIATAITETEFLQNLAAIIRGSKPYFDYKLAAQGDASPTDIKFDRKTSKRSKMEYKILNTLWTKQVNKFPDFSRVFTFTIYSNSIEYPKFCESVGKLMAEGIVGLTSVGQYCLTPNGFNYCKEHYTEFGSDQWWPEETINEDNLKKVLEKTG